MGRGFPVPMFRGRSDVVSMFRGFVDDGGDSVVLFVKNELQSMPDSILKVSSRQR